MHPLAHMHLAAAVIQRAVRAWLARHRTLRSAHLMSLAASDRRLRRRVEHLDASMHTRLARLDRLAAYPRLPRLRVNAELHAVLTLQRCAQAHLDAQYGTANLEAAVYRSASLVAEAQARSRVEQSQIEARTDSIRIALARLSVQVAGVRELVAKTDALAAEAAAAATRSTTTALLSG
ncbi:hypothetical protein BC828DRAFT_402360 [Blastocladiella britannica]|nr:hypothetical protein BC828DRAFT_402360 [Blastocladiella britannica]